MDNIKYYILLPLIALLSTASIYLILVLSTHKILVSSTGLEELVWQLYLEGEINAQPEIAKHMQSIVNQLPLSLIPSSSTKILVKNDDYINAYAAPGGRIILTSGMLQNIKSENALLFVIGHELAHLKRKDYLREFSRILIASTFGKITRSSLFPEILMQIDTKKTQEVEFIADKTALDIILHHYGHAGGVDEFFQILATQDNNKPLQYVFSSHPDIRKRHRKINEFIEKNFITKEAVVPLQ